MEQTILKVNFESEIAATRFMEWLNNEGQNLYWDYMQREGEASSNDDEEGNPLLAEPGERVVVDFDYDYDSVEIHTTCGELRVSDDESDEF